VRWLMEKVFGVSRQRRLPAFTVRNFFRRARGLGITRKSRVFKFANLKPPEVAPDARKVALFIDVFGRPLAPVARAAG